MVDVALFTSIVEVLLIPLAALKVKVLVAEMRRTLFNIYPAPLISEVHGVCEPPPQEAHERTPEPLVWRQVEADSEDGHV